MFNRTIKRHIPRDAGYYGPIGQGPPPGVLPDQQDTGEEHEEEEEEAEEEEEGHEQEQEQEQEEEDEDDDSVVGHKAVPARPELVLPWMPSEPPADMDPVAWQIKVALEGDMDALSLETGLTSHSGAQTSASKPMPKIINNFGDREQGIFTKFFYFYFIFIIQLFMRYLRIL